MPSDETIEKYATQLDEHEEIETTFQRLRRDGHSRKDAVRILLALLDCSLSEAKRLLVTSTTWADIRQNDAPDPPSSSPSIPPAPG